MNWYKCTTSFIQVVEAGSFAKAARRHYTSSSALSKQISELENQLNVQLLQRTTRHLEMTAEGTHFYHEAKSLHDRWQALKESVQQRDNKPQGTLTVGLSTALSNRYIVPTLPSLLSQCPLLKIDLKTTSYPFYAELSNIDLYFSHQPPNFFSDTLDHRPLWQLRRQVFAAPSYLKKFGEPRSIEELAQHNCLLNPSAQPNNHWHFENQITTIVNSNFMTDNSEALIKAAVAGLGLLLTAPAILKQEIADQTLVPILPELRSEVIILYAYFPKRNHLPLKVKLFLDHVERELKDSF